MTNKTRDQHSRYYCNLLKKHEIGLKGAHQLTSLLEIETDLENIRTAWDWATQQNHIELIARGADGLGLFFEWQGRYPEGEVVFRAAEEKLRSVLSEINLQIRSKLLTWESVFCQNLGNTKRAKSLLLQSQEFLADHKLIGT